MNAISKELPEDSGQDDVSTWDEFARRVVEGENVADLFGLDDEFIDLMLAKAYQLYRSRQFEQAEALLAGATALDETRSEGHLLLGDIMLNAGRVSPAVERLQRAHAIDEQDEYIQAKLGEAYLRLGQEERAMELLSRAVAALEEDTPHHRRASTMLSVCEGRRRGAAADT